MNERVLYQQVNKDHAYWTERGGNNKSKGGHTSGLLAHVDSEGNVVTGILFDTGLGTIAGLCELDWFEWTWPLDVFITHGHPDHHLELMVLSELWCRRLPEGRKRPLEVFSTQKTFDWLNPVHSFGFSEKGGNTLRSMLLDPSQPVRRGIFTIHAVKVGHFAGSVIYVIEFGKRKIIVGWDIGRLPDPDADPVLKNPSLALIDTTTWKSMLEKTGHTSIQDIFETGFIKKMDVSVDDPENYGVYFVHYAGLLPVDKFSEKIRSTYPDIAPVVRGLAQKGQSWTFSDW